jgi:hypothetical protein
MMANNLLHFSQRTESSTVCKDRVLKKYSLIGGFSKIVRQKSAVKKGALSVSLPDGVELGQGCAGVSSLTVKA